MKIDIKDTLTLSDGNRYIVVSKSSFQNNVYYYLIDRDNIENIKFCRKSKDELSFIEIDNKELIQQLLPLFAKASFDSITKEDLELMEEHQ